tara:strand:- start:6432 stop:7127 length:696 start_codon:yes stop_codon:yes gene_type:complete
MTDYNNDLQYRMPSFNAGQFFGSSSMGSNIGAASGFGSRFANMGSRITPAMPRLGGAMGKFGGQLAGAAAANPLGFALGAIGLVGGFFAARKERRRRRKMLRQRKQKALEAEQRLVEAAGGVREDFGVQRDFLGQSLGLRQEAAVDNFERVRERAQYNLGATNLAGSGAVDTTMAQLDDRFAMSADNLQLQEQQSQFRLDQSEESQLRSIQNNLLELSQYTGSKINVLDNV